MSVVSTGTSWYDIQNKSQSMKMQAKKWSQNANLRRQIVRDVKGVFLDVLMPLIYAVDPDESNESN
jgi:hypothetical protein